MSGGNTETKPVFGGGGGIFGNFSFQRGDASKNGAESEETPEQPQIHIMPVSQTAMRPFNSEESQWHIYHEQLEIYFDSLACTEDGARRTILLNCLGTEAYKIVRNMCAPTLPSKKTYKELCKILKQHYVPHTVVLNERKAFYAISKKADESVIEWLARIRCASVNCEFDDKLESVILDKFTTSLSGKAFERISEESIAELTLEKAIRLAIKYEAKAPADKVDFVSNKGSKNQNHRTKGGRKNDAKLSQKGADSEKRDACKHCGYKNHVADDCKFKQCKCHKCGITGHMARVCKQAKEKVNVLSSGAVVDVDNKFYDDLFALHTSHGTQPIYASVNIDRITHRFILDSGSSVSLVDKRTFYEKFSHFPIRQDNFNVCAYNGERIQVAGYFEPTVTFEQRRQRMRLLIVDGAGQPILGRDFMDKFGIEFQQVNEIACVDSQLKGLLEQYKVLFDGSLGKFKHSRIRLNLKANARPMFFKPRTVPYAFRNDIDKELARLEELNVITPTSTNEWGTPLVPIMKPDGSIRICADYKITLNKHLSDDRHPLPRVEDIFNALEGGITFTKLDLAMAYNQLELDDESRKLVAWSTHRGVYLVNRLAFGVKTATGIFQKEMEKLLQGIDGVFVFIDDIVVTGRTQQQHLEHLAKVFERLEKAGLRLKKSKCKFFQNEITYLGHVVNKDGIRKSNERIEAVLKASVPKSVTEVRAFAGLVNYYGRYFRKLADIMTPMYRLLKKGAKFDWDNECDRSFKLIKKLICEEITLTHFNPKLPIVLETDASDRGIGGVISHQFDDGQERPIAFFSRTLQPAEQNYPTIQKEALAIVESTKKFFDYLIGLKFLLRTDHKPLVAIFGDKKGVPTIAAARMQRWAHYLMAFDYTIEHQKGVDNTVADTLSRLPATCVASEMNLVQHIEETTFVDFIAEKGLRLNYNSIKSATAKDRVLATVYGALQDGRLESLEGDEFKPFVQRSDELATESGVIMWGHRTVIPTKLRSDALSSLHVSHLGIVKCKSMARMCMWWPRMDDDIKAFIKGCEACAKLRPSPNKAKLISWENTGRPWSRIHIDYAGPMEGNYYLIVIDSYSKWPEVFKTKTITADFTIRKLREVFARYGLPEVIVSDAGTQFTSTAFKEFVNKNGVEFKVIAPGHPASNGAAENAVKTFKKSLRAAITTAKTSDLSVDVESMVQRYLFDYRNSIHCSTQEKPSRVMFGRDVRTRFAQMKPPSVSKNIGDSQRKQQHHSVGRREAHFDVGDAVMIRDYRDPNHPSWAKATISEVLGQREYNCLLHYGKIIKRHLDQIVSFAEWQSEVYKDTDQESECNAVPDIPDRSNVPDAVGNDAASSHGVDSRRQGESVEGTSKPKKRNERIVKPTTRTPRPKRTIKPVQRYVSG